MIAGALSSYGVAFGSLTWNLNDIAVKGHLPASETTRVGKIFATAPPGAVRILTFHHNSCGVGSPGGWGSPTGARPTAGCSPPAPTSSSAGTTTTRARARSKGSSRSARRAPTFRTRGGRPSVFNLVTIDDQAVHIQHFRWENTAGVPHLGCHSFARQGSPRVPVSVAGGDQGPDVRSCRAPTQAAGASRRRPDPHPPNRTVMVSLARRVLRLHRGYAMAPDRVLRAIIRFLDRAPATRRLAEREFLGFPVEESRRRRSGRCAGPAASRRPGPVRRLGPPPAVQPRALRRHALRDPIRLSGRMRTRLGELTVDRRTGSRGDRPQPAPLARHPWPEVEHTVLHEMVHQWQAESGLPSIMARPSGQRASWASSPRRGALAPPPDAGDGRRRRTRRYCPGDPRDRCCAHPVSTA